MTQKYPTKTDRSSSKKTGFSDLGIGKNFLDIITKQGFETPTPIQHQIIPGGIEGKDVVGIAQTGTGKTLAFGIPMLQRLAINKKQGLILVPTRELAQQVSEALTQIGKPLGFKCAVVIGGVNQRPQVTALRNNPHIVIATPGRLADLMQQGHYNLKKVNIITLDEADRMLDVGFLPEIKRILSSAPKERQIMLFSATMPNSISKLATEFMKMPLRIEIAPQGTSVENIEQGIFVVRKNEKMRLLDSLLQQHGNDKTLIFSRTKHGAKRIARDIRNMKHTATEIHGNRSQRQREDALGGFKKGKYRIMVATDIAARGIDVNDIGLVINFDLPEGSEDYVHRIGRTGRAGKSGVAISFVTPPERADIRKIERLIRKSLPKLALPELPPDRPRVAHTEERSAPRRGTSFGRGSSGYSARQGQKNTRPKRNSGRSRSYSERNAEDKPSYRKTSSTGSYRKSSERGEEKQTNNPRKPKRNFYSKRGKPSGKPSSGGFRKRGRN
jgi:ATP-dependent RNA helicase RhlE